RVREVVIAEWCIAPKGRHNLAQGVSPGKAPRSTGEAPKGRHNASVSPLRGLMIGHVRDPGLTPWAKLCRPFGAKPAFAHHSTVSYQRISTPTLPPWAQNSVSLPGKDGRGAPTSGPGGNWLVLIVRSI